MASRLTMTMTYCNQETASHYSRERRLGTSAEMFGLSSSFLDRTVDILSVYLSHSDLAVSDTPNSVRSFKLYISMLNFPQRTASLKRDATVTARDRRGRK